MEREEVLRRAQKQPDQMDERELQVSLTGYRYAMVGGMVVCLILMLFKMVLDRPWQDVYAIICTMDFVQNLYIWIRLKDRRYLAYAGMWGAAAIALSAVYLMQIL